MALNDELAALSEWIKDLPQIGVETFIKYSGGDVGAMDYIVLGGVKRSLSLASGLLSMVLAKNNTCARAMLRMQVDTISRLLAYTYVDRANLNDMAIKVLEGTSLHKFKCRDGKPLRDAYLIDRMTSSVPWIRDLYDRTSGDVHFSGNQIEDSIVNLQDDLKEVLVMDGKNTEIHLTHIDEKYPKSHWEEMVQNFIQLLEMLKHYLAEYSQFRGTVKFVKPV